MATQSTTLSLNQIVWALFKQDISRDKSMREFYLEKAKIKIENEKKLMKFYAEFLESEEKRVKTKVRTKFSENWLNHLLVSREKSEYNIIQAENIRDTEILNAIDRLDQINVVQRSFYAEEMDRIDCGFKNPLKNLREKLKEYDRLAKEYQKDLSEFEQHAEIGYSKEKKYNARVEKHQKIFLRYALIYNECYVEYQKVKFHCQSYLEDVIPSLLKELEDDLERILHRRKELFRQLMVHIYASDSILSMEHNKGYMESLEKASSLVQDEYKAFTDQFTSVSNSLKKEWKTSMDAILVEHPHLNNVVLRDINFQVVHGWQQQYEERYNKCDIDYVEMEAKLKEYKEQNYLPYEVKTADGKEEFLLLDKLNEVRSKFFPLMAKRFQIRTVRNQLRKVCDPLSTVTVFHKVIPQFKCKQKTLMEV
ncbi:uncharacterized protein TRIADDRAFT_55951 [Trichoplax adhaerens]|uniref:F-BAR domain-containing protein n=1 Tax=Trichoplax adhaerens TaxID=10228 RepID=B3RTJ9_TRIAD|nr:hypothetical protein TRIADDRAFT_55951 [Trichoplax adhaerens]EDV26142.1 hypothetical protein TRIADDRAFT_55951 [Trichoplax adhaerens]|eukprot:XP_002112175.1 hypothetical protein TRIADDRAFT_55951 [Trichoplax adhaerens]